MMLSAAEFFVRNFESSGIHIGIFDGRWFPIMSRPHLDKGVADVVVVAKASLLFVDTSPLWMEKFIATLKRHNVLVADTMEHKDYALRKPEDEAAFGA